MPTDRSVYALPSSVNQDQQFSEEQAKSLSSFASDSHLLETCQIANAPCSVCIHEAISPSERLASIDLRIGLRLLGPTGRALLVHYITTKRASTRARAKAQRGEGKTDGNQDYHD